jgi:hypothetical protein
LLIRFQSTRAYSAGGKQNSRATRFAFYGKGQPKNEETTLSRTDSADQCGPAFALGKHGMTREYAAENSCNQEPQLA